MNDPSGVVGLDLTQYEQRLARNSDIYQRLLATCAEAPDSRQVKVRTAALDRLDKGVIQALGSIAPSARSHADGNARDRRYELVEAGLANRIEYADVLDSRHHSLSRSSARTSR